MEDLFIVSSSPHYRAKTSTRSVMLDVIIALVPALVVAVVFFGLRALTLVLVSVLSCVLFETLFNRIIEQNFVPVVDSRGMFSGIVTRKDVLMRMEYKLKQADMSRKEMTV